MIIFLICLFIFGDDTKIIEGEFAYQIENNGVIDDMIYRSESALFKIKKIKYVLKMKFT